MRKIVFAPSSSFILQPPFHALSVAYHLMHTELPTILETFFSFHKIQFVPIDDKTNTQKAK